MRLHAGVAMREADDLHGSVGHNESNRIYAAEEIFDRADADGDQIIDVVEFRSLTRELDSEMSTDWVEDEFRAIDHDRDGRVDFAEFKHWWCGY
jgi:Ca2+-binding EF-hand superfamily protein